MSKINRLNTLAASVVIGALSASTAQASGSPFQATDLATGYQQLVLAEGKCGEGKCGEGMCGDMKDSKGAEGKCGEGKCGEGMCGAATPDGDAAPAAGGSEPGCQCNHGSDKAAGQGTCPHHG